MERWVEWKSFYSVGDPSLDEEHRQLLGVINDLHSEIAGGNQYARVLEFLDRLTEYTMSHFEHEEKVMKGCGFPDFQAHKAMHEEMQRRTLELHGDPEAIASPDLLEFVRNWWVRHIQNQDKAYSPYLDAIARQPVKMA